MIILWIIFGASSVNLILFATAPDSKPRALARAFIFSYLPSSIKDCKFNNDAYNHYGNAKDKVKLPQLPITI
jgi:hypothetical protein